MIPIYILQQYNRMHSIYNESIFDDENSKQNPILQQQRIWKTPALSKSLHSNSSVYHINKIMCMYKEKERQAYKNYKSNSSKSLKSNLLKSLLKYSKKKSNLEHYIENQNKKSLVPTQQKMEETSQVKIERKYNAPLSIKYATIKEIEQINENRQKMYELKEANNSLQKQPLVKNMKKLIKNGSHEQAQAFCDSREPNDSLNFHYRNCNTYSLKSRRKQRNSDKNTPSKSYDSLNYSVHDKSCLMLYQPLSHISLIKKSRNKFEFNTIANKKSIPIEGLKQKPKIKKKNFAPIKNQFIKLNQ